MPVAKRSIRQRAMEEEEERRSTTNEKKKETSKTGEEREGIENEKG